MYTCFTYYMSSPAVSCLQSAPAKSRKRYNIWNSGKRRKTAPASFPPARSQNRAGRKRAPALCKVTYIAARAIETERKRAHCTRRRFIDLAIGVVRVRERERTGRFSPVNRERSWLGRERSDRNEGGRVWYLWKIDSACAGCTCPVRREPDAGVNTSESARQYCRINGKDCLFNRVTGSSASTDLN